MKALWYECTETMARIAASKLGVSRENANTSPGRIHGNFTQRQDNVRGQMITSWPSVKTDLINAGANWVDDEVAECNRGPNTLVSSRKPDDLPPFCNTLVGAFAGG